jgi:hypothetical protein
MKEFHLIPSDDYQLIEKHPVNPVSSFMGPDCTLGVYALWTIESIRVCSVVANSHPFRFPSSHPILMFRNPGSATFNKETAHQAASKAYNDWRNSNRNYRLIKNTDPIVNTDNGWR